MGEVGSTADLTPIKQQIADMAAAMPVAATTAPPAVADTGAIGSLITKFATADHTHASKVRKARVTSAADGTYAWTFSTPFDVGVTPIVLAVAEVASGITDVVNVQVVGTPTNTGANLLVNRTNRSVVALIGLTVLSVPTTPGATVVHVIAVAP